MIDWNRNGKIDAFDHAITSAILDEKDKKASGCCGPTTAMILMCIVTPVILVVHLLR